MSEKSHAVVLSSEQGRGSMIMHPLVQQVIDRNPDPETLQKLLDMQRQWERDEAHRAYTQALVGLKRDLPSHIDKDQTVDFTSQKGRTYYKHSSLAQVLDSVTEILSAHGFALNWIPSNDRDGNVTVRCQLTHCAGHTEFCEMAAPYDQTGSKSKVQGIASTQTLLMRYTAMGLLGLASREMTEPHVTPEQTGIDMDRNARAVSSFRSINISKVELETYLGKPFDKWDSADLASLRAYKAEKAGSKNQSEVIDAEAE